MAAGARCGRGAGAVAVRQWRRKRSEIPTAVYLQKIRPVSLLGLNPVNIGS
jgi:hypothetical protein